MGNPIKVLAITNTVLLVLLIVFILVVKAKTESGEKVSYFSMEPDETTPPTTPPVTPAATV